VVNKEEVVHVSVGWFYWAITGGMSLMMGIIAFWVKRWINSQDTERDKWNSEGGLMTRDTFFRFCRGNRDECPAVRHVLELQAWQTKLSEDGGLMPRLEHAELCKEITREVTENIMDRLKEMFDNHRVWVGQELRLITQQQELVAKLVKDQMKAEDGRWGQHDEMARPKK
jgi:hypothetical protein